MFLNMRDSWNFMLSEIYVQETSSIWGGSSKQASLQYKGTLECRRFTKTDEIEILEYILQWWVSDFNQKKKDFNRRHVLVVANWSTHPLQYSNQNQKFHFNIIMKFSCNDQHIFSGRGAVVNVMIIELISIVKIWWDWKLN